LLEKNKKKIPFQLSPEEIDEFREAFMMFVSEPDQNQLLVWSGFSAFGMINSITVGLTRTAMGPFPQRNWASPCDHWARIRRSRKSSKWLVGFFWAFRLREIKEENVPFKYEVHHNKKNQRKFI
jgi:hypothetical protein